jgi:AcrR family transcriptional regulator
MAKLSVARVKAAIPGSIGNYALIAKRCDCTRMSIWRFFQDHPELKEAVAEDLAMSVKEVENRVFEMAKHGELKDRNTIDAAKFILMNHTAYAEKKETKNETTIKDERIKFIIEDKYGNTLESESKTKEGI